MKLAKQDLGKVAITVEKQYWNTVKAYDRLTIVEVMGVGCYISRKPVPAGIQYDNREYWIKLSNLQSGGGGSTNVVTEFGDSVLLAIAQKTISDRFDSVDGVIASIQTLLDTVSHITIPGDVSVTLQECFDWFYNDEYLRFAEETTSHLSSTESAVLALSDDVAAKYDELITRISAFKTARYKLSANERFCYIGGRMTTVDGDASYLNKLRTNLGFTDNRAIYNFQTTVNLNRTELPNLLYAESLRSNNFANTKAVVIQFDSLEHTVGEPSDIPDYGDEEPAHNFYGNVTTEIDKIHAGNPNCQVFLIAPPDPTGLDNPHEKVRALENIAIATGSIFINPNLVGFSTRYADMYDSVVIAEMERPIPSSLVVNRWGAYVAHEINFKLV